MLAGIALRAAAAPLVSRASLLAAARCNSTVAAPEPAQSEQPPAPARKSRIPLAQAYGDLAIPDRDSAKQFARTRSSTVGTHRLGQDQFAGRGDLASRLLKKRQAQVSREQPKRTDNRRPRPLAANTAAPPDEKAQAAEQAIVEAREKAKRIRRGQSTMMEVLPNRTDLSALFNAPTPASHQVVPLNLAKQNKVARAKEMRTLERLAGEYRHIIPKKFVRWTGQKERLERYGTRAYARVALMQVRQVTVKQKNAVDHIITTLVPSTRASTVHTS